MADFQDLSGLPTDDTMAQMELQRRLKIAQALQQEQMPQGQMVSGHYVSPSFTQYGANLLNKYIGGKTEEEAMKKFGEYNTAKENRLASALKTLGGAFEPKTTTTMQAQDVPLSQGMNVPTSPFGTTEQVGQTSPFGTQNMVGTTTQMNPVTTTTQPTTSDIEKAFAQYATDIKDPKMLASILTGKYEKMLKANEPIKINKDEMLIDPTTKAILFKNTSANKKYTDIQQDKAGNTFGLNTETNQFEQLPGAKMATEQWSPPYKVGGEFVQRNTSTGEIRKAYESGDKQTFTQTTELRNDFNNLPQVKSWNIIEPVLLSAREASKDTSGASDLNMIYALGKVLDPNSVVREGELEMAGNTGSLGQKIAGYYKSVAQGGRLTPEIKQDLLKQIESRTFAQRQSYESAKKKYSEIAKKNNIDPNDLFINTVVEPVDVSKSVTNQDAEKQQALDWIKANPNDPRVPKIKQKLGIQ